MISSCIVLAFMTVSPVSSRERTADEWYAQGLELRHDAGAARTAFSHAARLYTEDTIESLHAGARAWYLAGDPSRALAKLHLALSRSPTDRELQADLETIRDSISYPTSPISGMLRPKRLSGFWYRISPFEIFLFASACGLCGSIALILNRTQQVRYSLFIAILGYGMMVLCLLMETVARDTHPLPTILAKPTELKNGNGSLYSSVLPSPLPSGMEVKQLARRGGWVRVQLPDDSTGWLPESVLLK